MALIGERWGVFPRLKQWVSEGRPVWGTCAGMILLSDHALMMKKGGQALVGGLNVEICRNYFGAQKSSFEIPLDTSALGLGATDEKGGEGSSPGPYPAVFIRAPAILEVGPGVDVLCKVRARPCNKAVNVMNAQLQAQDAAEKEGGAGAGAGDEGDEVPAAKRRRLAAFFVQSDSAAAEAGAGADGLEAPEVIVAIRKGNIVGTSFHPELTNDARWHKYFVELVKEAVAAGGGGGKPSANVKPVGSETAGAVPAVA
ncbi:unnamed protein product [Laminaria digitata]